MSNISHIYGSYSDALDFSREKFYDLYTRRARNASNLHHTFFHQLNGAKGQINLDGDPPTVQYKKWTMDKDVSMVTYIPVPFSEFADVVDQDHPETFLVSDSERVDLSNIDTRMMELAEIYLAYNVATSSALEAPKIILLDRSPSSSKQTERYCCTP